MKDKVIAIAYPSTAQFRNATNFLKHNCANREEVKYIGTVKLHGTNGSMVKNSDGRIYFQSKSRVLDLTHDNSGFCRHMEQVDVAPLFEQAEENYRQLHGSEPVYPIELAGEWAGKGIQKGVAISEVDKFFSIFAVRFGHEVDTGDRLVGWEQITNYANLKMHEARIFNILDFGKFEVSVKVALPQLASQELQDITLEVEAQCPAGKFFNIEGVGEGVVWTPADAELVTNPQSWFKVKGQKHSVSKVSTLAAVDPEKLESMQKFVDYACTEARLEQGVQEIGLDVKSTGKFIGWVNKDIHKEEADTLEANGLTMKEVGKLLSNKARQFYLAKL